MQVSNIGSILTLLYIFFLLPIILFYKAMPTVIQDGEETEKEEDGTEADQVC